MLSSVSDEFSMSSSSSPPQNNNKKKILGGPFTITLLNRIFAFNTNSGKEAILTLGLVCKQWREAEMFYCHDMWKNVCSHEFGKYVRGQRWSHYAYMKRVKSLLATKKFKDGGLLNEIEHCGDFDDAARSNDDDGGQSNQKSSLDFRFRCPMLARNLRILPDTEEIVFENEDNKKNVAQDRPVLFCDVCEKKVYPFSDPEKAKKFVAGGGDGHSRCVVISKKSEEQLTKFAKYRSENDRETSLRQLAPIAPGMIFPGSISGLNHNNDLHFNLAVVTTETSSPESDAYDGLAEQFIKYLAQAQFKGGHVAMDDLRRASSSSDSSDSSSEATDYGDDPNFAALQAEEDAYVRSKLTKADIAVNENYVPPGYGIFLAKDLAVIERNGMNGRGQIHVHIVRVPPSTKPVDDENGTEAKTSLWGKGSKQKQQKFKDDPRHPALPNNVLGKNNMPTVNGWNAIVVADPAARDWFIPENCPTATPVKALLAADMAWCLYPSDKFVSLTPEYGKMSKFQQLLQLAEPNVTQEYQTFLNQARSLEEDKKDFSSSQFNQLYVPVKAKHDELFSKIQNQLRSLTSQVSDAINGFFDPEPEDLMGDIEPTWDDDD